MKNTVNITLEEIIKRKIQYFLNEEEEISVTNQGYVRGFEEMLKDMGLPEDKFVEKYHNKVKEMARIFDRFQDGEKVLEDIEELSGYNNSLVDVLTLLDFKYLFAEEN